MPQVTRKRDRRPKPMPSLGLETVEKTRDKCRKLHKEVMREMDKHPCPMEFSMVETHTSCSLRYLDKLASDMKCRQRAPGPRQKARREAEARRAAREKLAAAREQAAQAAKDFRMAKRDARFFTSWARLTNESMILDRMGVCRLSNVVSDVRRKGLKKRLLEASKELEKRKRQLCRSEQWAGETKQLLVAKGKELEEAGDRASRAKKAAAKAAEAVQKWAAKAKKVTANAAQAVQKRPAMAESEVAKAEQ